MDVHQNARTTLHGRCLMISRLADGWTVAEVAAALASGSRPCSDGWIARPATAQTRPGRPRIATAPQPDPAQRRGGGNRLDELRGTAPARQHGRHQVGRLGGHAAGEGEGHGEGV